MNLQIKNAVILAAGSSTRFGENKLLQKIEGKTLPQYAVEFCIKNGIKNIYITINRKDIFIDYSLPHPINHPIIEDLKEYEYIVDIQYKFQDENKYGPAAAILPHLEKGSTLKDNFIVLFGDNYYDGRLEHTEAFKDTSCIVSYKKYDTSYKNLRFAVIKEGILIEKPHTEVSGCYFCGYVIFDYETVKKKIYEIELSGRNEYEITELCNSMKPVYMKNELIWEELTYKEDVEKLKEFIRENRRR